MLAIASSVPKRFNERVVERTSPNEVNHARGRGVLRFLQEV